MKFFDYIFYRVSRYYLKKWDDDTGPIYGIGLVSIMQLIHVLFLAVILSLASEPINEILFERKEGKNFLNSGIIYPVAILFIINFTRYLKFKKLSFFNNVWENEPSALKKKRGWLIILYIVLNLVITTLISIYRRYYF
ncbi:MAG: hypothetical protein K0B09_00320 [Bacteroidales bacterium]|nr:hypothetical protein [Bacteroidales bacterium]